MYLRPPAPCLHLGQVEQGWPADPPHPPQISASSCEELIAEGTDWQTNSGRGTDYAADPNTAVCTAGKWYGQCYGVLYAGSQTQVGFPASHPLAEIATERH